MNVQKHYLIKELSTKSGVSIDSIRFYEKKKLLKPSFRADNNYRYYDEEMYNVWFLLSAVETSIFLSPRFKPCLNLSNPLRKAVML